MEAESQASQWWRLLAGLCGWARGHVDTTCAYLVKRGWLQHKFCSKPRKPIIGPPPKTDNYLKTSMTKTSDFDSSSCEVCLCSMGRVWDSVEFNQIQGARRQTHVQAGWQPMLTMAHLKVQLKRASWRLKVHAGRSPCLFRRLPMFVQETSQVPVENIYASDLLPCQLSTLGGMQGKQEPGLSCRASISYSQ